jgi:hypothetical protein
MKRSLSIIVLAASLAAIATAAGAQSSPPPAGSGFTVIPGIVIPQTAGSSFSVVTAATIQYGPTFKPSVPRPLHAELPVSMPGAASKANVVGVIPGPILGPNLSIDIGSGNRGFIIEALSAFQNQVYSVAVTMTTYQYQGGTWSGQSRTRLFKSGSVPLRMVVGAAPVPGSQPAVYKIDVDGE